MRAGIMFYWHLIWRGNTKGRRLQTDLQSTFYFFFEVLLLLYAIYNRFHRQSEFFIALLEVSEMRWFSGRRPRYGSINLGCILCIYVLLLVCSCYGETQRLLTPSISLTFFQSPASLPFFSASFLLCSCVYTSYSSTLIPPSHENVHVLGKRAASSSTPASKRSAEKCIHENTQAGGLNTKPGVVFLLLNQSGNRGVACNPLYLDTLCTYIA